MKKKVFISYSRKDALDIAEFRSITKYRDFEIVIDDEEITFNQPWKENIVNKINQSDAAILFISKNALNPESPIRSLEIPLIAKRSRDKEDNFNFFPIFLEEVGKELDEYSFTTIREGKEVNFLEIFQVLDIEKQNTLSNQSRRKRNRFFRNINANISHVLKGGTLSPGQNLITQLSRKQKLRWALASILIVFGIGWFTTTDAYARVLIAAYEQRIADGTVSEDSVAVRFLADQLNSVENLDELTTDEVLKESITEIADLNINLDVNSDLQNIELSSSLESTTTTTGSTTTTTGSTTTTIGSTTTTIVDTIAPTFTKALTATNITAGEVDISWKASDNVGISYYVLREGSFIIYQGTNTFKEVEGLTSNKSYTFSVDAYDKAGNFSTSEVTFKTLATTTTTTIPTFGVPVIYKVTVSGSTITAYYSDASTNTGLAIVGHGCEYSTIQGGPSGGTSTQSYSSSCSLDFPAEYTTVSIKVKQSFEGQISCGEGCYTDNWTNWSNAVTVYLTGSGSISDNTVEFIWDIPPIGPGCYPDTYPKNKQVNSSLLPLTQSEVRQSLLDYGNSYGRLCGDDLVNSYINYWKTRTADDIKNLYPAWSESVLNTYLNGNGSGGWYNEWNSTPLTTTTTTTLAQVNPYHKEGFFWWVNNNDICFYTEVDASSGTIKWKIFINEVLAFSNSGPAGQSTHFTLLKTGVGSPGDTVNLRVEVYDGNDVLFENTNFASTILGSGSPYYENITDVGNECSIGKTP